MAVRQEGFRTYSELRYDEYLGSISNSIDAMTPEEREAFFLMLEAEDIELEGIIRGLEYDRECVDIETWLQDPYYMGDVGRSIFKPWKDDLIELFASKQYDKAFVVGSIGCIDESTKLFTRKGVQSIGDLEKNQDVLSFDGITPVFRPSIGPFPKGKGDLYRVVTEHSEFLAYGSHRVFCADYKYRSVDQLICGDVLFWHSSVASLFQRDSIEGSSQRELLIESFRQVLCSLSNTSITKQTIKSITLEKKDQWYWDIQVADTNCYFHDGGYLSHNSGKSTFSHLAIIRMMYEISCLRDPQATYGLAPDSEIVFCNLAPVKDTARKVVVEGIMTKIRQSPYFMGEFRPIHRDYKDLTNIKSYEINFPKKVTLMAGSSLDTAFIGLNVIGGVVEELNFFRADPKHMAGKKKNERWGEYSKAGKIFDSILRRMKSRFIKKGKLPGILLGVSSKTTDDAITSRMIKEAIQKRDSSMFVRDRSVIDVRRDSFSNETFKVLVGNQYYHSRILKDREDISELEDAKIIDIPMDLKPDFESDINSALRDLAGISTLAIDIFFSNTEKVYECIDKSRVHPFVCWAMEDTGWWDSRSHYRVDWHKIAKVTDSGDWLPLVNPDVSRFIHLDPALTGDAFGFCMAHVAGLQKVERKAISNNEETYEELLPIFHIDFVVKIQGTKENEILFKNVRQLIYLFSEHGFQISKISADKFQSREMLQQLESQGYTTDTLSVDEDIEPYKYLRSSVYDGRVTFYKYDALIEELIKLEDRGGKVDHTPSASKDIADALCGCVWSLYRDANFGNSQVIASKGISEVVETKVTEDFENVKVIAAATANQVKYVKPNRTQSQLKPKYTKIRADGTEEDLTKSLYDVDYFLMRG